METEYFRRKGWSQKEIDRARKVLDSEKQPHVRWSEQLHYGFALFLLMSASLCFTLLMYPFLLFAHISVILPIMLVLGLCTGMMFVHVLRTLRIERARHMIGAIMLAVSSWVLQAYAIELLQLRFTILPVQEYSGLLLALPYGLGIIAMYFGERRF